MLLNVRHFLVLGAGASHGARVGTSQPNPPVGEKLADYLEQWLASNDPEKLDDLERIDMENPLYSELPSPDLWKEGIAIKLMEFLYKAKKRAQEGGLGFEKVADELWRTNPELIEPLNLLMAWSMLTGKGCAFPEYEDRFDYLLCLPEFNDGLAVITLNYDILFEEAMRRVSDDPDQAYFYPGLRLLSEMSGKVPIFKLHGSINWLQLFSSASSATLEVAQRIARQNPPLTVSGPDNKLDTQREYVPPGSRNNLVCELKHHGTARNPILGLYAPKKPIPYNRECVERVRMHCLETVAGNADVTIIGVHIPELGDDPCLNEVLSVLGKLNGVKKYIGPDDGDRAGAARLGFEPRQEFFNEIVEQTASTGSG